LKFTAVDKEMNETTNEEMNKLEEDIKKVTDELKEEALKEQALKEQALKEQALKEEP